MENSAQLVQRYNNAQLSKKKEPSARNGFEKGLMPERIVGLINIRGKPKDTRFLIKWLYEEELEIVSADEAKVSCPILVLNFYKSLCPQ